MRNLLHIESTSNFLWLNYCVQDNRDRKGRQELDHESFVGHILKFGCGLLKGDQVRICQDGKWRKDLKNKKLDGKDLINWILRKKLMSNFLMWEFLTVTAFGEQVISNKLDGKDDKLNLGIL